MGWTSKESGFDFQYEQEILSSSECLYYFWGSCRLPVQWMAGNVSLEVKLTCQFHLA